MWKFSPVTDMQFSAMHKIKIRLQFSLQPFSRFTVSCIVHFVGMQWIACIKFWNYLCKVNEKREFYKITLNVTSNIRFPYELNNFKHLLLRVDCLTACYLFTFLCHIRIVERYWFHKIIKNLKIVRKVWIYTKNNSKNL